MLETREDLKRQNDLKRSAAAGITKLVKRETPIKERLAALGNGSAINNYARVDADMLYSVAFNSLSASDLVVLLRLLQKRKWRTEGRGKKERVIYNNNGIRFTYKEASCFGISAKTFSRAINKLVSLGFISIAHQGGGLGTVTDCTRFNIINDWKQYGTPAFKPRVKEPVVRYNNSLERYNSSRAIPTVKNDSRTLSKMTVAEA
jgi:hypothetical protein